jgi:hypothetical protein
MIFCQVPATTVLVKQQKRAWLPLHVKPQCIYMICHQNKKTEAQTASVVIQSVTGILSRFNHP